MAKRKRLGPARTPVGTGTAEQSLGAPVGLSGGLTPASGGAAAPISSVASDAALSAALEEVTETLQQARNDGRMILELPLDAVRTDYLVRDRLPAQDEAMEELVSSLRMRGQQAPIEVVALTDGTYGLISGWRRMAALAQLTQEGQAAGVVLALLKRPEDSAQAYMAMVEENEIRVGLSYYERARIAVKAVEQGAYPDLRHALQGLFANASRPRRSKIGSFARVVEALDRDLRFPTSIGERLGLVMAKAVDGDGAVLNRLKSGLAAADARTPEAEQRAIEAALKPASKPKKSANIETKLTENITLTKESGGALVLKGGGVDVDFQERLVAWVRAQSDA